jgi:voltage-gated potassium channel
MTVISVTTVGYREVHPLSRPGEAFTVMVVTFGVATVLYTFSFLMARLVEGDLQERWVRRRRRRMLDELTHHFIICGFGRIGQIIAREFARQAVPFVIIERDPDRMKEAIDAGYLAVEADASSEEVLQRIGIARARGFIAAVSTDAENVYAVLTARLLRPDLYIIGRAETEDAKQKLLRAGCDRVLSPYQIGGMQLAQTALRPAVVDFVQLATSSDNLDLNMEQVEIAPGSQLAGKTIVAASLRQRFGVVVVGIQRASGAMEFNPPPESVMGVGDCLVVLGQAKNLRELEAAAGRIAGAVR